MTQSPVTSIGIPRQSPTLDERTVVVALTIIAVALAFALLAGPAAELDKNLQRAVAPRIGFVLTAPLSALASLAVLAWRRRRVELRMLPSQLLLAWLLAAAAFAVSRLPRFVRDMTNNYRQLIALYPPDQREPTDLGADLPFLESIRHRLENDERTLVLTESFPCPDLPVVLYPIKGQSLTLKMNPHPDFIARLRGRKPDDAGVSAEQILEGLRKSGLLASWRDLSDPAWREYVRGFDAIVGLNVGIKLEELADFEVVTRFDPRRVLLKKKKDGS